MPDARDLPLLRWGADLRRARIAQRRMAQRFRLGALGIAALAATIVVPPVPRLVWNTSSSAPPGLYRLSPGTAAEPGDMVIARVPRPLRDLAARRRYLPANLPLVKQVAAARRDTVCAAGASIFVNGRKVAERQSADGQGRPMPWWNGCHRLEQGELFLLMDGSAGSFDGRYFGVSAPVDILGKANLLWAR